jgi:predicted RNA-binding protein with PUA-like domain
VDIAPGARFKNPVTIDAIRANPELANMVLLKRGRLSVQPVTEQEWNAVMKMGR